MTGGRPEHHITPATEGALALARPARQQQRPRRALRLVTDDGQAVAPRRMAPVLLHGLVQAIAEVLGGCRAPGQLANRIGRTAYETVCRARHTYTPGARPRVGRIRASSPVPGAIEVSAVVRFGPRWRALALRLDWVDDRWLCTQLRAG